MSYEEVVELKPIFWSLDTFNSQFFIIVVLATVIGFLFIRGLYRLGKNDNKSDENDSLPLFPLFLTLVAVIYSTAVIVITSLAINNGDIEKWEATVVEDYIKETDVIREDTINKKEVYLNDLFASDGARVSFVVDGKMITKDAELVFAGDVVEPYITYHKNDRDFSEDYKKGQLFFLKLHLPKDYSF